MRILIVVEKEGSAIHRLALGVKKYNPHFKIDIISVHPKRPSAKELEEFQKLLKEADIVDFQYWKTAVMLLDKFGDEIKEKKIILAHHNPYDLFIRSWEEFDVVVVNNSENYKLMPEAELIFNTIDLDLFKFNENYTDEKSVLMVAARIESNKGILEVAKACSELGYKFILVGRVSNYDYFQEVLKYNPEVRIDISDEELVKAYKDSAIYVCNSKDNFESGPLPVLEAMAVGVPVLTRSVGSVPDWYDGKNMVVRKGQYDDLDDLKRELKSLMEDKKKRLELRENAWRTAIRYGNLRRAVEYQKLYYRLYSNLPLVSVIIPTYNRAKTIIEVVKSVIEQKEYYQNIEIIIADDGSTDNTEKVVKMMREGLDTPIKYINTGLKNEYGLAVARNMAVIEAAGDILVFLDDRLYLEKGAISELVSRIRPKTWLYGKKMVKNKEGRKTFVENFSCVLRQDFIDAGMCNERIRTYGGMTQEINKRFSRQGFDFIYVPEAVAREIVKSSSKHTRKDDIRKSKELLWLLNLN